MRGGVGGGEEAPGPERLQAKASANEFGARNKRKSKHVNNGEEKEEAEGAHVGAAAHDGAGEGCGGWGTPEGRGTNGGGPGGAGGHGHAGQPDDGGEDGAATLDVVWSWVGEMLQKRDPVVREGVERTAQGTGEWSPGWAFHAMQVIHPIIVTPNHSDLFIVTFVQSNIVTSLRLNQ